MIDLTNFIELAHQHSYRENRGQFVLEDFAEKLVELVVLECGRVADMLNESYDAPKTINVLLKSYFGLKHDLDYK